MWFEHELFTLQILLFIEFIIKICIVYNIYQASSIEIYLKSG